MKNDPHLNNKVAITQEVVGDTGSASRFKIVFSQRGHQIEEPVAARVRIADAGGYATATNAQVAPVSTLATQLAENTSNKDYDLLSSAGAKATGTLTLTGVAKEGEVIKLGNKSYKFNAGGLSAADLVGFTAIDISDTAAKSRGLLTIGAVPTALDAMQIGGENYVFVANGTANAPGEIAVGAAAVAQVEEITCVADDDDSLDGTSFLLHDEDGSVAIWIDTDDSGTSIPTDAAAADRAIEVTAINTDDTDEAVATAVAAVIDNDSKFSATSDGAVITVTHADAGDRTDGSDGDDDEATGFSFAVETNGAAPSARANVIAAINGVDGVNNAHPLVSAIAVAGTQNVVVEARSGGAAGDAITTTESFTSGSNIFDDGTLGTEQAGDDTSASEAVTAIAAALSGNATGVDGDGDTVDVTAAESGVAGNFTSTTTMANASFGAATLTGGVNAMPGEIWVDVTNATPEGMRLLVGPSAYRSISANFQNAFADFEHEQA